MPLPRIRLFEGDLREEISPKTKAMLRNVREHGFHVFCRPTAQIQHLTLNSSFRRLETAGLVSTITERSVG